MDRGRKTIAEHAAAFEIDQSEKIEKIRREGDATRAIMAALPADFSCTRVYPLRYAGAAGAVYLGDAIGNKYRYGAAADSPPDECSWSDLCGPGGLLRKFPPVPLTIVRGACTGLRPTDFIDPHDRDTDEREHVEGVTFKVENSEHSGQECKAEWWSDIARPGAAPLRVYFSALIRREDWPATFQVEYKRDRSSGTVTGIERKNLVGAPWCRGWQRIMYAGGGHTDPGHPLLYWPAGTFAAGVVDGLAAMRTGTGAEGGAA